MDMTLDEVRHELAVIHDELLALPTDAFGRRSELRDRQHELRQLSSQLLERTELHDADTLRKAYHRLHAVRDHLLDQRLSESSTSVGDAGVDSDFTNAVNRAIDAGIGTDEIEKRLEQILRDLRNAG